MLALLATQELYEEQPELWEMGEHGRARTLEDFGHHFLALAALDETAFVAHVDYCIKLFEGRGLPLRWLDDAWRVMAHVAASHLPPEVAVRAATILSACTRSAD